MVLKPAKRTENINEYYFSAKLKEIAVLDRERKTAGKEGIINLGIGAPDGMPPAEAVDELVRTASLPDSHAYQSYVGIPELRQAFASWYSRYYGVDLDYRTEIQPLTGSKEGVLLVSLAFLDKGDKVLVPDPGYPTYTSASLLAQAEVLSYDLVENKGWQPDFESIEKMDLSGVKIMWTNYPNMPTGGMATKELYEKLVSFGKKHGIMICNDNPYSFILSDRQFSILGVDGAKEYCIELNSLSKVHNMSGWRIGMVAGDKDVISQILKVKSQMDSGMFRPLQHAAVRALSCGPAWFSALNEEYAKRREAAAAIFDALGVEYSTDSAGLFLWGKVQKRLRNSSVSWKTSGELLSDYLLYKAGIFITPGFIFGNNGKDYIRISLCANMKVLHDALHRIMSLQHEGMAV